MGWNSTTKIMTAPLNINANGDIQRATDMSGHGDLGDCIVNGTINKWAKFKPVRSGKIAPVTSAELASLNYGLKLTEYTSITDLISGVTALTDWAYLRPRNNGEDRFRFYDFTNPADITATGYRGDANCFLGSVESPNIYTQGTGGTVITANINTGSNLKSGSVGIADLTDIDGESLPLGDLYLGVLLKNGTSYAYKTSSVTIGSQTHTLQVTLSSSEADALPTVVWEMYIFLAVKECQSVVTTASAINRTYLSYGAYALPGIGKRSLTVQSAASLASASIKDDEVTITTGAGRYWVGFDIAYLASSSSVSIYASYEIYGGNEYGSHTTLILQSSEITLHCTSSIQYYSVSERVMAGWPPYITVALKYRIGTSPAVYTAPEVSVPTEGITPDDE